MNVRTIVLSLLLTSMGAAHAGEQTITGTADIEESGAVTQYLIGLSEYQLAKPIPADLSEAGILKMILDSKATPVQTVQLTASADTLSMVNFGKQVTVTTGKVVSNGSTSRLAERIR